jgi:NAD(P)-dependent dehydrogenase (short-subunit alcohol dehydrogenase family)
MSAQTLKGKTLFITGASRGIGLAIGLRAARDGANIAIAAKTSEANPKLPGTIYTAAKEIEKAHAAGDRRSVSSFARPNSSTGSPLRSKTLTREAPASRLRDGRLCIRLTLRLAGPRRVDRLVKRREDPRFSNFRAYSVPVQIRA